MTASTLPTSPPHPSARGPGSVVVIKFGGTSLATAARIRRAARRVRRLWRAGHAPIVVVSATGHTTDRLLRRCETTWGAVEGPRLDPSRERDRALATGEDLSAALLAGALLTLGVPALSLHGGEAGIRTAGEFGAGRPVTLDSTRLRLVLAEARVPVVAGFQGVRADNETVTLGRGGSDISAVFLAVALSAVECQIVTDVDGVYSADPNLDPDAWRHEVLTHAELVRISQGGAVVVHPLAAQGAWQERLSLRVFHHGAPLRAPGGTLVHTRPEEARC